MRLIYLCMVIPIGDLNAILSFILHILTKYRTIVDLERQIGCQPNPKMPKLKFR